MPKEVQDCGLVVDVDFGTGHEVAEFISRSVGPFGLYAAASHEHGEAMRMVVAAQVEVVAFFVEGVRLKRSPLQTGQAFIEEAAPGVLISTAVTA